MTRRRKEFILFQRDCYSREDYEMWCEDNGYDFEEVTDSDFYAWCEDEEAMDFQNILDECKYSKFKNIAVVVEGSVGLWYGRREVEQTKCDNFVDAIYKCMGRSCEIDEIKVIDNHFEVTAIHHDGRNYFDIYFLSELGADRLDRNGQISTRNRENILKIPEYVWY